jgi:hypothetical protein
MSDQVQKQAEKLATNFELANEGQISFHTVVNDLKHLSPHNSQTVIDQANQKLTADGKVGDLTIAGLDTEDKHKVDVWSAGGGMKVIDSKGHSHDATHAQIKSASDRLTGHNIRQGFNLPDDASDAQVQAADEKLEAHNIRAGLSLPDNATDAEVRAAADKLAAHNLRAGFGLPDSATDAQVQAASEKVLAQPQ